MSIVDIRSFSLERKRRCYWLRTREIPDQLSGRTASIL